MPGTTNNLHIVTGIPFAATFGSGVNTFTVAGNFTSMFGANGILTVIGGSPNGGYRQITSAVFSAGNTTVTSTSYSTGTAYPGPTNFTSGSGTVILFSDIAAPSPSLVVLHSPGVNSGHGPLFAGEMNGVSDGQVSDGPPNYNGGSSVGGSLSGTVFGTQVQAIVYEDGFGNFKDEVILYGSHPQNYFSSISFTSQASSLLETFTSASATYAVITGTNGTFTYWQWNAVSHYPFGFGPNVTVTFNP